MSRCCSPGASAPGLIAGVISMSAAAAVMALRGPRPPASLRGRGGRPQSRRQRHSPGASAPGLIAGKASTSDTDADSKPLSGGLGPRPHCGVTGETHDQPDARGSPGASAPGLIAGWSAAPTSVVECLPLRGPRPPASLRVAGPAARPASWRSSPGASAPGLIAGGRSRCSTRHMGVPLSGGLGPRPHCGLLHAEHGASGIAPLSGGLGPRPHWGGGGTAAAGPDREEALSGGLGPRPHCGCTAGDPVVGLRLPSPGPRPPASLRGPADHRRHPISGCSPGASAPGLIAGWSRPPGRTRRLSALRGPRPPASLRVHRLDPMMLFVADSPGASAPGLIARQPGRSGARVRRRALRGPRTPASLRG